MIEAAAQTATDYTWQRVAVSILTVLAFVLTSWGLFHAFTSTRRIARSLAQNLGMRNELTRQVQDAYAAIQADRTLTSGERDAKQQAAETRAEEMAEEFATRAGIPFLFHRWPTGSEPVAETLVRELSEGTRTDLWIAGAGLILGLIAGVWGIWI